MARLHIFFLLALFGLFLDARAATVSTRTAATAATATVSVDYTQIVNSRGDKLPDFSYCGYHASEKGLPPWGNFTATLTLNAGKGNQAPTIQAALDKVAAAGGGVVALDAGTFEMEGGLIIPDKTILRGAGIGISILTLTNLSSNFISMGNANVGPVTTGVTTNITSDYVPVGASDITVASTAGFTIGQTIFVQRKASAAWIKANGMDTLVRNGHPETWIKAGKIMKQPRKIKDMSDNVITVDVPLTDSIDSAYDMEGQVVTYTAPAAASTEIGLENLSISLEPTCSGAILNNTDCSSRGIFFNSYTTDSWVRNIEMLGFNQFVFVAGMAMRITIENVTMHRTGATDGGAGSPFDLAIGGTQVLVTGCSTYGANNASSFSVVTEAQVPGPNAVVNHFTEQSTQQIQPHQRWASGFLVDSTNAPLSLINRGIRGSGHGWTINAGVGWNVKSTLLQIQSPPTGENYCIGCIGTPVDKPGAPSNGTFIALNEVVQPPSLFAAQLAVRGIQPAFNW